MVSRGVRLLLRKSLGFYFHNNMHVYFTTIFPDACAYDFDYFIIRSYSKLFNHNTCVTASQSRQI